MKDYSSIINHKKVPKHIAIIMDGNRRWAEKRSLPRLDGHRKGTEVLELVTESAAEIGVEVLSLYVFSTENWSRPKFEVEGLWKIFNKYLGENKNNLISKGVRIRFCGFYERFPKALQNSIKEITELTKNNKKITLNMCFNYGGRQDILNAVNQWKQESKPKDKLTDKKLEKYLLTAGLPEIDLMIRTSGEYRISNFLIWQLAYTELVFLDVLWPDFTSKHLYKAIYDFQNRERRFGGW